MDTLQKSRIKESESRTKKSTIEDHFKNDLNCFKFWETLRKAATEMQNSENQQLRDIVLTASKLCTDCINSQYKIDRYQHACDRAKNRQVRKQSQMRSLLSVLSTIDKLNPLDAGAKVTNNSKDTELDDQEHFLTTELRRQIDKTLNQHGCLMELGKENTELDLQRGDFAIKLKETASNPKNLKSQDQGKKTRHQCSGPVSLRVYLLGRFQVIQDGKSIINMGNSKSRSIFKYLLLHRTELTPKEVLMETFWPDTDPQHSKNSLNVTVYKLRKALPKQLTQFSHIIYKNDSYIINPDISIWVDIDEFKDHVKQANKRKNQGDIISSIALYRKADSLYSGDIQSQGRYDEWIFEYLYKFQNLYREMAEILSDYLLAEKDYISCISVRKKIVKIDPGDEPSHRQIMLCYYELGQRSRALRQYNSCKETLNIEYNLDPDPKTRELYLKIINS